MLEEYQKILIKNFKSDNWIIRRLQHKIWANPVIFQSENSDFNLNADKSDRLLGLPFPLKAKLDNLITFQQRKTQTHNLKFSISLPEQLMPGRRITIAS